MKKYTNEEILETLPVGIRDTRELTQKQKVVLGQLLIYNGLEQTKNEGFFYRSNKDLCADCSIEEHTLITAVRKLEVLGLIERRRGSRRDGASEYRVFENKLNNYCNNDSSNYSEKYSDIITAKSNIRNYSENYSTESDKEIDKEIEIVIYNIINNTSKKELLEKLNVFLEEILNTKQVEDTECGKKVIVSQPVAQFQKPIEDSNKSQLFDVATNVEPISQKNNIPIDEKRYQEWIWSLGPMLSEYSKSSTMEELDEIMDKTMQAMMKYSDEHQLDDNLCLRMANVVAEKYQTQKEIIDTKNKQMLRVFKQQVRNLN